MNNGVYTNPINDVSLNPVEIVKVNKGNFDFMDTLSKSESASVSEESDFKFDKESKNVDVKDEFDKASVKTKGIVDSDDKRCDEIQKFVEDKSEGLVLKFAKELNVSDEELITALENLSLVPTDLFEIENLYEVVMEVNGLTDSMDLVTDPDLSLLVKNLEEISVNDIKTICDDLGISTFDLKDSINELKSNFVDNQQNDVSDNFAYNDLEVPISDSEKETDKSDSDNFNNNLLGNSNVNINDAVENSVSEAVEERYELDAQEIYDRIGDYIRTSSSEELNEVELQLQPESLGTLQVRVTQREGTVSAEMIAQNDNVKAALESQLIQLKEDFEKAGITVNEIEVKVSTNSFNESTDSDSRDEANEEAFVQRTVRRINLADIVDMDSIDELEDEEKIAAEMMTANGNTMDYMV